MIILELPFRDKDRDTIIELGWWGLAEELGLEDEPEGVNTMGASLLPSSVGEAIGTRGGLGKVLEGMLD